MLIFRLWFFISRTEKWLNGMVFYWKWLCTQRSHMKHNFLWNIIMDYCILDTLKRRYAWCKCHWNDALRRDVPHQKYISKPRCKREWDGKKCAVCYLLMKTKKQMSSEGRLQSCCFIVECKQLVVGTRKRERNIKF